MIAASGRDDTLVVVTADHETGSFGFSYFLRGHLKHTKLERGTYTTKSDFGSFKTLDKPIPTNCQLHGYR